MNPEPPDIDPDDFSDLDSIIADAEARKTSARAITAKTRRLSYAGVSEDEKLRLLVELRLLEDKFVWRTVAGVALFHSQRCLTCEHEHRFFMGWMTLQEHRNDPNCRRYIRGRPDSCSSRVERHAQTDVELCADCVESCLAIEAAASAADALASRTALEPHRSEPR